MALFLDGHGDGLKIPDSESLHIPNAITIEARVKLADVKETDGGNAVVAKGISIESAALWASFFKCKDGAPAAFFDTVNWVGSEVVINPGEWVNLAVTYDRYEAILYINGQVVGRKALHGGLTITNEPLFIGQSPVPGDEDFAGFIKKVMIWNIKRTPEEMNQDFEDSASMLQRKELVLAMFYNGNFNDSTSYHNDGVPIGDAKLVPAP